MHGTFKSNKGMRQALNGLFWRASPGPHGCLRKRRLSFYDMIVYQHTVIYFNSCYFYANIKMQSRVPDDPISKCLEETSRGYSSASRNSGLETEILAWPEISARR